MKKKIPSRDLFDGKAVLLVCYKGANKVSFPVAAEYVSHVVEMKRKQGFDRFVTAQLVGNGNRKRTLIRTENVPDVSKIIDPRERKEIVGPSMFKLQGSFFNRFMALIQAPVSFA